MAKKNDDIRYGLGLAVNTVIGVRASLGAAFNFAVDEKLISENPVKKTSLPPPSLSSVNPLTIEEAWAFVSVKDHFWYGDAFSFDLQTGLRPKELEALIEDDIDFDKGEVRIERACKWVCGVFTGFGPVKTRRSERIIQIAPDVSEFLQIHLEKQKKHIKERMDAGLPYGEPKVQEWINKYRPKQRHKYTKTNLIFPSRAGTVPTLVLLRTSFKRMLRRAGFVGDRLEVRLYDLRHTHATILLTLDYPDHEVAARMGHPPGMLNNIYAHQYKSTQRKASVLFANLIPLNTSGLVRPTEIQERITLLVAQAQRELEEALSKLLNKSGYAVRPCI